MMEEHYFQCPYCWQQISMLLDLTGGAQSYVEDCEVCCNPITVSYEADGEALLSFAAEALGQ